MILRSQICAHVSKTYVCSRRKIYYTPSWITIFFGLSRSINATSTSTCAKCAKKFHKFVRSQTQNLCSSKLSDQHVEVSQLLPSSRKKPCWNLSNYDSVCDDTLGTRCERYSLLYSFQKCIGNTSQQWNSDRKLERGPQRMS